MQMNYQSLSLALLFCLLQGGNSVIVATTGTAKSKTKTKTQSTLATAAEAVKEKLLQGLQNLTHKDPSELFASQYFSEEDSADNLGKLKEVEDVDPCPNGRTTAQIVSLNSRYDRWERTSVRFMGMSVLDPTLCLEVNRYVATNGAKDPIPETLVTKKWSTARNREYVGKGTWYDRVDNELSLTDGERGCAASHIRLWKDAAKKNKSAIILEDDAVPVPGFSKKLKKLLKEVPKDADLLYLGYSRPDKAPWRRLIGDYIAEVDYVWTTVGYVLFPSGARKLLERLPVDSPVDNFMSWASHTNATKAYAAVSPVLKQEAPWGIASDVEHSDEKSQHQTDTENLKKQMTLLARPIREAQQKFMQEMNDAIFNIGEEPDATTLSEAVAAIPSSRQPGHSAFEALSAPKTQGSFSQKTGSAHKVPETPLVEDFAKAVGKAMFGAVSSRETLGLPAAVSKK